MKRNSHFAAEKYFRDALKLDDNNEDAWFYLGENYFRLGKFEKAIEMFKRVNMINPSRKDLGARIIEAGEKVVGKDSSQSLIKKISNLFKK